ncbi:class I SAM-dependent methyltransferase [Spirochaeta africana]|uniref:Protein-L-isoaspartate carboxylmethyltransferase n=1 Tax=Spirochaeta africana (strain ATCC 700263 / DSM 8902 / Z-7692) TaxID=889378 RepID=H9UIB4_SPIAZ|nr:class I SAM-dependent methyltransferase [Spirochaeta africana]AFG37257.1 protein-L-isoaspartate carboxylmethyltransferase [Spirochaeta africana DSM 8902]
MSIIQPVVAAAEKLCAGLPIAVRWYSAPYESIVQREIDLASITEHDRVLQIGCGAIPFTAIHLAQKTGARVTALDIDPTAVAIARRVIAAAGLEALVKIRCGDGCRVDASDCTVALVALQARPKQEILQNLLDTIPTGSRLVFRAPAPRFAAQYDAIPTGAAPSGSVFQPMKTFDRSILYAA